MFSSDFFLIQKLIEVDFRNINAYESFEKYKENIYLIQWHQLQGYRIMIRQLKSGGSRASLVCIF